MIISVGDLVTNKNSTDINNNLGIVVQKTHNGMCWVKFHKKRKIRGICESALELAYICSSCNNANFICQNCFYCN